MSMIELMKENTVEKQKGISKNLWQEINAKNSAIISAYEEISRAYKRAETVTNQLKTLLPANTNVVIPHEPSGINVVQPPAPIIRTENMDSSQRKLIIIKSLMVISAYEEIRQAHKKAGIAIEQLRAILPTSECSIAPQIPTENVSNCSSISRPTIDEFSSDWSFISDELSISEE
ncbi:14661_t:CDS:2 [Cetraspora pellucida]|uniref:14661_t:CDS:1 n=1 Tax=Cetraspora pellucida TaxID=1433469 RepID=A0ACA9K5H0_9GLOM|nr:14661_t:CDS:2 [Cetraspora pellucida]